MLKHLLPVALIMLALISYFVLALVFGIYQAVPWPHFLVASFGCLWLAWLAVEAKQLRPWLATATGVIFTGLFIWYTMSYSAYDARTLAVSEQQVVGPLADLRLLNQNGEPAALFEDGRRATLVVFYRGYW